MITAFDQVQDKAVLGVDVDTEGKTVQESTEYTCTDRFRCLLCGSDLIYSPDQDDPFGYFRHGPESEGRRECINSGNVSPAHRLAQEVVSKTLVNAFPKDYYPIQIDIEGRIGTHSEFVVADVRLTSPVQIAVEVVYLSNNIDLRRRLKTLFSNDYLAMLVVIKNGRVPPDKIEHHLQKISPVQVGRFDPHSLDMTLGTVINSNQIDPDDAYWDLLPDYLS